MIFNGIGVILCVTDFVWTGVCLASGSYGWAFLTLVSGLVVLQVLRS